MKGRVGGLRCDGGSRVYIRNGGGVEDGEICFICKMKPASGVSAGLVGSGRCIRTGLGGLPGERFFRGGGTYVRFLRKCIRMLFDCVSIFLLYTPDAADELLGVVFGRCRYIYNKNTYTHTLPIALFDLPLSPLLSLFSLSALVYRH